MGESCGNLLRGKPSSRGVPRGGSEWRGETLTVRINCIHFATWLALTAQPACCVLPVAMARFRGATLPRRASIRRPSVASFMPGFLDESLEADTACLAPQPPDIIDLRSSLRRGREASCVSYLRR